MEPVHVVAQHGPLTRCDAWSGLELLLDRLTERWLEERHWYHGVKYHGYVPLPIAEWLEGFGVVEDYLCEHRTPPEHGYRFLDVGSGLGIPMFMLRSVGWRVSGIELNPEVADASRQLVPDAEVLVKDAFSFADYNEYDFVYSYRLCLHDDLQDALDAHIISHMRPGALLFLPRREHPELRLLGKSVWLVD